MENAKEILEKMIKALDEVKNKNPDTHAPIRIVFEFCGREFCLMETPKSIFPPEYKFQFQKDNK